MSHGAADQAQTNVSEHTVRNYLIRIFDKLGISRRVELVLYAFSGTDRNAAQKTPKHSLRPRERTILRLNDSVAGCFRSTRPAKSWAIRSTMEVSIDFPRAAERNRTARVIHCRFGRRRVHLRPLATRRR